MPLSIRRQPFSKQSQSGPYFAVPFRSVSGHMKLAGLNGEITRGGDSIVSVVHIVTCLGFSAYCWSSHARKAADRPKDHRVLDTPRRHWRKRALLPMHLSPPRPLAKSRRRSGLPSLRLTRSGLGVGAGVGCEHEANKNTERTMSRWRNRIRIPPWIGSVEIVFGKTPALLPLRSDAVKEIAANESRSVRSDQAAA